MTATGRSGFLHRWSRRKSAAREGASLDENPASPDGLSASVTDGEDRSGAVVQTGTTDEVRPVGAETDAAGRSQGGSAVEPASARGVAPESGTASSTTRALASDTAPALDEEPPLTLQDVQALTQDSDFAPFVTSRVAPEVKNAALKKLFSDPHYNIMDGLDTYIDDYSNMPTLPAPALRRMVSAQALKMFDAAASVVVDTAGEGSDASTSRTSLAAGGADAVTRGTDVSSGDALAQPRDNDTWIDDVPPVPAASAGAAASSEATALEPRLTVWTDREAASSALEAVKDETDRFASDKDA